MKRLVYVSGPPGAGKTSLAVPLAAELGYALITKDKIKETLHDALGGAQPDLAWSRTLGGAQPDLAWSRALGGAAMELLWTLAGDAPRVVIEANFRPYSEYERAKLSGLGGRPVEVYCLCPAEVAATRYNARVRHPAHHTPTLPAAAMAQYDRPVGIGDLVTVDTTAPVDVTAVAAQVRRRHAAGC